VSRAQACLAAIDKALAANVPPTTLVGRGTFFRDKEKNMISLADARAQCVAITQAQLIGATTQKVAASWRLVSGKQHGDKLLDQDAKNATACSKAVADAKAAGVADSVALVMDSVGRNQTTVTLGEAEAKVCKPAAELAAKSIADDKAAGEARL